MYFVWYKFIKQALLKIRKPIFSYDRVFTNQNCVQKDLRLAVSLSEDVSQPLSVIGASNELFKRAVAEGYGERDMASVYRSLNHSPLDHHSWLSFFTFCSILLNWRRNLSNKKKEHPT